MPPSGPRHEDAADGRPVVPYGSWPSPIPAAQLAGANLRFGQTALRGEELWWIEGRPAEQGRNVLVRCAAGGVARDAVPAPFDVRTRAHEYGGGAFALLDDGGVVFSHDGDRQLWRLSAGAAQPERLTDAPQQRFADAVHDASRHRLIAVREDHRGGPGTEAVNTLVAIDLRGRDGAAAITTLAEGHDFFSSPCISPDGRHLAWLSWDHPDMPWDASTLWLAGIAPDDTLAQARRVAGGAGESIFQPAWSPRGELHFVSDRSGWWNLYRLHDGEVRPLHPMRAEFGVPQWAFGMSTYGFDGRGRVVCTRWRDGRASLARLDPDGGAFEPVDTPFCAVEGLRVAGDVALMLAAGPMLPQSVVRLDLAGGQWQALRTAGPAPAEGQAIAVAEAIDFPCGAEDAREDRAREAHEGDAGESDAAVAHAFFYRPANAAVRAPRGEKPPLLVFSHGGPTGAADAGFKWSIQFWTSRGFAVVDVNYGGSSGWGRAYRERLAGRWGIVDVRDAIAAARHLVERGEVDPDRIAIRGSSAGGFTTLAALTFHRFFKAGASLYGIGDLETLARDTHKFESRYLDRLVGPYPAARDVYRERSPIHHTDRLAAPMILLQGSEDRVVPPEQARAMFDAVRAKGLPVALLMFEGEQHGFRRAATIRRALEAELYFYGRAFGFAPADAIEPVPIENLPAPR